MHRTLLPWKVRYGVAFLMIAFGTLCVGALMALISVPVFVFYIVLITLVTLICGIGSGLVSAALALLVSNYLFLPPYFSMESEESLLLLVITYFGTVVLSHYMKLRRGSGLRSG
jgi:K+-sensing histidine kinase KdpD